MWVFGGILIIQQSRKFKYRWNANLFGWVVYFTLDQWNVYSPESLSSFRGIKQIELFREMHPHQKAGKSVWWLWLTSRSICKKFIKQQKFASWDLMVQPPIPEMIYLDITWWAKSCGTHGFQVTRYSQCHCNLVKLRIPQPYRIVESTNPKKVRALHWNRQRPPKNKVENQSSGIQNVAQKVRGSSWTKLSNLDMAVGLAVRGVTKDF